MKKIIFLSLLVVSFASCKKKYNCRCTTTVIYQSSQSSYSSKNVPMKEKMKEKQAKAVCANEAENINATYTNYITNNGNWSSNGVNAHTTCALE